MKLKLLALILISFFAEVALSKQLECRSFDKSIFIKAQIKANSLIGPMVEGKTEAYLIGQILGTESRNGKWSRFGGILGNLCWHSIIIPSSFSHQEYQSFRGVLDRKCETEESSSWRLNCTVK